MKTLILTLMGLFFSAPSFAGKVGGEEKSKTVTISYNSELKAWTHENKHLYTGGKHGVFLIPITDKSFKVMGELEKDFDYNCVIEKSTIVLSNAAWLNNYILDMNCD